MSRFIETKTARLHLLESGAGEPAILFLHYWGGSARTWHRVIQGLGHHVHAIALDQRGWGKSVGCDGRHDLAAMADDVADVVASLGLHRYVLVGHSMGGKVAQLFALRQPSGLAGLVLVAPAPPTPMQVPADMRAAMLDSYQTRQGAQEALKILTYQPLDEQEREALIADTLRGTADAKRSWTEYGMIAELGADLLPIAVPTIILVGDQDRVERAETLRRSYARALPHAELRVLEGVGHLSPLEAPGEIARACVDVLQLQVGLRGARLLDSR
jgi:pimeloyl-ACP methyl ester carboxylesterase